MEELQPISKRVEAEIKRLVFSTELTPEYFNQLMIDEKVSEAFASTLAVQVLMVLIGNIVATAETQHEVVNKTEEVGYYRRPLTWWDGLKFTLINSDWLGWAFSDDAQSKWVEYEVLPKTHNYITQEKRTVQHYHLCPLPANTTMQEHLNFLGWKQPFTGTHREYMLLRKIAKESLLILEDLVRCNVQIRQELIEALNAYILESNRLSEANR